MLEKIASLFQREKELRQYRYQFKFNDSKVITISRKTRKPKPDSLKQKTSSKTSTHQTQKII
jgi:hypothetical protein